MKYKTEIQSYGDLLYEDVLTANNPLQAMRQSMQRYGYKPFNITVTVVNEEGDVWITRYKDTGTGQYKKMGKVKDYVHKDHAKAILNGYMSYEEMRNK